MFTRRTTLLDSISTSNHYPNIISRFHFKISLSDPECLDPHIHLCNKDTDSSCTECEIDDRKIFVKPKIQRDEEDNQLDDHNACLDSSCTNGRFTILSGYLTLQKINTYYLTR